MSSTYILNSDESSTMLTANSGTQLSTSEENYDVDEIGQRISDDSISKNEDETNASLSSSNSDYVVDNHQYANSISPCNAPLINIDESIDTYSIKNARAKEISNIEECEKFEGLGKATDSKKASDKKEVLKFLLAESSFLPDCADRLNEMCEKNSTNETLMQVTRVEISNTKDSTEILNDTILSRKKAIDTTGENPPKSTTIPKTEITPGPKRRAHTSSDSSSVRSTITNFMPICTENERIDSEMGKMKNVDETSSKSLSKKTPVTILKDYAKQCNEKLEFKVIRSKANSCEIECSFASYNAKSMGYPESSVQNNVAVLILRMLAEEQMDEKDMKNLIPFSNEQMRDVVAFGTGGQPENAMRKLYKLCLEKNAPKPVYSVQKDYVSKGVKNIAECAALNKIATGDGIREIMAKISAAEKLYRQLLSEQSS